MPKPTPEAIKPPKGSICATCSRFAGGTCPILRSHMEATEQEELPVIIVCPSFQPEEVSA